MSITQQTIQCSRCKKRFFEDGFKINRLRQRLKTCLECNERESWRRTQHADMRLQAFDVIKTKAKQNGWTCLAKAEEYTNAQTPVEWECITCSRIYLTKWRTLSTYGFKCPGSFHNKPELLGAWQRYAEDNNLDAKRDMKDGILAQHIKAFYTYQQQLENQDKAIPPKGPTLTDDELAEILGFAL